MSLTTTHIIENQDNLPGTVVGYVSVSFQKAVTRQDMDDIIAGSYKRWKLYNAHWASHVEINSQHTMDNDLKYAVSGFEVTYTVENEQWVLDEAALICGIQKYVHDMEEPWDGGVFDWIHGFEESDSVWICDDIVQISLFGEVRYT